MPWALSICSPIYYFVCKYPLREQSRVINLFQTVEAWLLVLIPSSTFSLELGAVSSTSQINLMSFPLKTSMMRVENFNWSTQWSSTDEQKLDLPSHLKQHRKKKSKIYATMVFKHWLSDITGQAFQICRGSLSGL